MYAVRFVQLAGISQLPRRQSHQMQLIVPFVPVSSPAPFCGGALFPVNQLYLLSLFIFYLSLSSDILGNYCIGYIVLPGFSLLTSDIA